MPSVTSITYRSDPATATAGQHSHVKGLRAARVAETEQRILKAARELTGPTLADRIDALAEGITALMERAGDLFEVVLQAQAAEPELAEAFSGRPHRHPCANAPVRQDCSDRRPARSGTRSGVAGGTVALAAHAETYLLLRRTTEWTPRQYRDWLHRTLDELLTPA